MTLPKDSLPGITILMLDAALSTLDRASEETSIELARKRIAEAQSEIRQVLDHAISASKAE